MYREYIDHYTELFQETIDKLGGGEKRKVKRHVFRMNVGKDDKMPDKNAFFGCINDSEEASGPYSDLSIVVFPSNEGEGEEKSDRWIVSLAVGSLGFNEDFEKASLPGCRRKFAKYLPKGSFIKNSFIDIQSQDGFTAFSKNNKIPLTLNNSVSGYKKEILACTIFDPNDREDGEKAIEVYLSLYAEIRDWPSNQKERDKVNEILNRQEPEQIEDDKLVEELLEKRKYIVLQGAPGTGKTRLAKELTKKEDQSRVFFTQFHAETSYSDFVYGIIPKVDSKSSEVSNDSEANNNLSYIAKEGVLVRAIRKALEDEGKPVYLIIDEINRANLSNVLGPSFYLFEPNMSDSDVEIEVCPGFLLKKLPKNFFVIATMNTADRSLAVVDFALRRRFAWYTLYPKKIKIEDKNFVFREKEFFSIENIFYTYASDEELNLQPGHAYFIVPKKDEEEEMKRRLKYEIMPLIKEYLQDGMLSRAKDDFINYFREVIGEEMYF